MADEVKLVVNIEEAASPYKAPPPPSMEDVLRPEDIPARPPAATPQPAASLPPSPVATEQPAATGILDANTLESLATAGETAAATTAAAEAGPALEAGVAAGAAGGPAGAAVGAAAALAASQGGGGGGGNPFLTVVSAAGTFGPLGAAAAGLTEVFQAGTGVAQDFFDFLRSQTQDVAPFSPELTQANVEANIQDLLNRIERAQEGGDELAQVRQEMTELNQTVYRIATNLIERFGPTAAKILDVLEKILTLLSPFIDFITWILRLQLDVVIDGVNILIRIANMFGAGLGLIKKFEREKKKYTPQLLADVNRFFSSFIEPGPVAGFRGPEKPGKPRKPPRPKPIPDDESAFFDE